MTCAEYSFTVRSDGLIRLAGTSSEFTPKIQVDFDGLGRQLLTRLESPESDLVRVASAIYQVDRLASRHGPKVKEMARELEWPRVIRVTIEVSSPSAWQPYGARLAELLRFLTDDTWELTFGAATTPIELQTPLFTERMPTNTEAALFSGGLDSLAGACARFQATRVPLLLLGISTNTRRAALHASGASALRQKGVDLRRMVTIREHLTGGDKPESTQRTRGLFFLAIGAAVSRAAGLATLLCFENGPGSLNVPMSPAQAGAQNTRSAHPETLCLLESILTDYFRTPFSLELPFFFSTKAEVCRAVGDALEDLARVSNSCDQGERGHSDTAVHCGTCTSCLLRRVSLFGATGKEALGTTFLDLKTAGGSVPHPVSAYHYQGLALFEAGGDYRRLVVLDPNIQRACAYFRSRGMSEQEYQQSVTALLSRYSAEILSWYRSASLSLRSRGVTK